MLYDEPLSNLDPSLRRMMRDEILRLHQLNGTTSVYVTHDLEEAMHLSDRVVVDGVRPVRTKRVSGGDLHHPGQRVRGALRRDSRTFSRPRSWTPASGSR